MKRPASWAEALAQRLGAEVLERAEPRMLQRYGVATIAKVAFYPPAVLGEPHLPKKLVSAAEFLRLLAEVLSAERAGISLAREPEQVAKSLVERVRTLGIDRPEVKNLGDVLSATFQEKPSLLDITAGVALSAEVQEASVAFRTRFEKALERAEELATSCLVKIWCQDATKEWMGSGFVFNGSDCPLVMTARHVVEGAESICLKSQDGSRVRATVVAKADGYDLTILKPDGLEEISCTPCKATLKTPNQLRGHQVLLIGFHAAGVNPKIQINDACASLARVVPFAPLRTVQFRDGWSQPCLTMLVGHEQETVREGMSGGPIIDLETDHAEIVAVITGAQAELINQPYPTPDSPERLPVAEYAFGTLLQEASARLESRDAV